jgi:glycosyltransferase involved in cell wall biosynthesis
MNREVLSPDKRLNTEEKILFVIHGLGFGGSEMFFINLVNGFKSKGYQPVVLLLREENPLLNKLDSGIPVHIVKRRFRLDLGISAGIKRIIRQENITKVFCVEPFSFFLSKRLFLFQKQVRFYLSLHNSIPITKKKHLQDLLFLRLFQKNDKVIFICNFQKQCYKEKYFFHPRISQVIYNGIDISHYSREATERETDSSGMNWKQQLGLSGQDKTILITGRLALEKGHLYAIGALQQLHSFHHLSAHLIIVGGGTPEFEAALHQAAEKSGLKEYIHFTGSRKDVRPYLYQADLFTLTSFSETFSMAALEALSMGVPCSLTRIGGSPEMIMDDAIGMLCESRDEVSIADSWNQLLRKEPGREKITAFVANRFSFEKMLENYILALN